MAIYFENVQNLLSNNPYYPQLALDAFIYNEFKNQQPNFRLMGLIFKLLTTEKPESKIAKIYLELLQTRENVVYLQQFLRKLLKAPPRDGIQFDLVLFASELLSNNNESLINSSAVVKDHWFANIIDMICLSILLCIPIPFDSKTSDSIQRQQDFQMKVSTIQKNAIIWCHSVVSNYLKGNQIIFLFIKKVLFLESPEGYSFILNNNSIENNTTNLNSTPQNSEINLFVHLQNEIPVNETTTARIILMGLDPSIHLLPENTIEILHQLYYRAANLQLRDSSIRVMNIENSSIIGNILQLTYVPPKTHETIWLSSELYWKACILLVSFLFIY